MQITKEQIQKIHGLLPAEIKQDKEAKGDLVEQYTGDASKRSTRDLSFNQANNLISNLGGGWVGRETTSSYAFFDKDNHQHKYILSLCQSNGWSKYSDKARRNVADLDRLAGWLQKYGYLHKPLRKYTPAELPALITQLEKALTT